MKKILSMVLITLILYTCIPLNAMATGDYVTDEDISYNSTNALGDILSDAIDENEDAIEDNNGYGIYNVTLSELIATVYLASPEDSTLVVAIYDEDTNKMVTSGKAKVNPNMESVEVTLADCEMPDYYIIKAFILDVENAPVCNMYQNNEHTKLYEEFFDKTIFDFDEEKVINLDAGIDSNFVVVSDDAEVIEQKENENIVIEDDYENGIFKFENANADITSLKSGDILYYVYGDGEEDYILTKIGSIETRGNVTTITAADDCDMGELFSYMDIDTAKIEEQQTYSVRKSFDDEQGKDSVEKTFSLGSIEEKFGGDDNYIKLSGGATATVHLKFHYDYVLFGKDYYKFEYWIRVDANATVTLFTEKSKTFKGEIIDTYIPVITGLEIHVEVNITFTVKMSLTATGSITFSVKYGAKRDSTGKQEKIVSPPDLKLNIDISGKYEISIVPKLVTGFKILKVFHVDLNIPVTFKTEGTVYFRTPTSDLTTHSCKICADGDVKYKFTLNITVKFGLKRWFMKEIINYNVPEDEKILGVYYISIDDNNQIIFGWGECPNNLESGNLCGENARWKITQDGELVIFGEGEMENYSGFSKTPWYQYRKYITKIIVEDGITYIGKYAFSYMDKVKTVELPDSLKEIGQDAFHYSDEIESIEFGKNLTDINGHAFNGCDKLTSITIPDNVEFIGAWAFANCNRLETVILGNNLKEIEDYTFLDCKKLKNVIWGNNISKIGFHAFDNCDSLNSICIPDSVKELGSGVFSSCNELYEIDLGNGVETLAYGVFRNCKKLNNVKIGSSLRKFEFDAFENCTELKAFEVDSNNSYFMNDENGVLYNKDKTTLLIYPAGNDLETYTVPDGVTKIDRYSFEYATNLTKIILPTSLSNIGSSAFNGCSNLSSVCYKGNELQWDNISKSGSKLPDVPIRFNYDGTEVMMLSFRNNINGYSLNKSIDLITETVESPIKNYSYIIIVVKDREAEDLLSSDNLLFIDQKIAGDEPLTFEFTLDEAVESYDVIFTYADLHEHSYTETVVPASCEEGGYTLHTCECGDSFIDNETEANGHSLKGWYTSTTATCTTAGVEKNDCSECDYSETREVVATGHSMGNWYVVSPAKCETTGLQQRDCLNCTTYSETENIPAIGHNFEGSKCSVCGYDKADDCSCNCHGNIIQKIIFKITNFFASIFDKSKKICACGISH